ncbi:U3 small nucleolar RNA-associated protein 25 [Frankliniella fusca]|uniref:U3 small nucleolar RNA-associated protein 25 n=1 Tax=Frankliniella fusca TaxID=407009 RepID=A0AAE1H0W4_9NEOP|nr:U3 small nucleolar RNA-associated protein 25 [Frankliniella fusca]
MRGYLGMTVHLVRGENLISIELAAHPMPERKASANLEKGADLCNSWGIIPEKVSAVITDGGSNITAAVRVFFGPDKHVSCFAHALNGIGQSVIELHAKRPVLSEEADGFDDADATAAAAAEDIPEDEDDIDDAEEDAEDDDDDEEDGGRAPAAQIEVATNDLLSMQADQGVKQPVRLIQEVRT